MRESIVLSDRLRRPTSVFGVAPPRRWLKSPPAKRAAVASTSRSGRKVEVTRRRVSAALTMTATMPKPRKIDANEPMMPLVSARLAPMTRVARIGSPSSSSRSVSEKGARRHCAVRSVLATVMPSP